MLHGEAQCVFIDLILRQHKLPKKIQLPRKYNYCSETRALKLSVKRLHTGTIISKTNQDVFTSTFRNKFCNTTSRIFLKPITCRLTPLLQSPIKENFVCSLIQFLLMSNLLPCRARQN